MERGTNCLHVRDAADIDRRLGQVDESAPEIQKCVAAQDVDPLELQSIFFREQKQSGTSSLGS